MVREAQTVGSVKVARWQAQITEDPLDRPAQVRPAGNGAFDRDPGIVAGTGEPRHAGVENFLAHWSNSFL